MSNRTPLRFLTYAIVTGSLLFSAAHLIGCTTTGQLAGKSGPVSAAATVQAACAAVTAADGAFQVFAKAHPGVIDANGMSVEGGVMATVAPLCASGATPNTATAEAALISAAVQIATLLTTWQK